MEGFRILVVDDEPGIRRGCRRVLEPLGYRIAEAASLAGGLQQLQAESVDLALIDVMLPDGRGMELLEPIHRRDPDTVCIVITGYATVELAVQAIREGAYDFLAKPFDAEVLELAVRQGLEKRSLAIQARQAGALEARLAASEREKAELARLDEFKTHFMWVMAHELRSPLGAAQSLLRTLLKGLAGPLEPGQLELIGRVDRRLTACKPW